MAEPVDVPMPRTDPRNADLQGQIEELRLALRDWRRTREYSQPTQERLEQITLQCARMVEAWQQAERRQGGNGAAEERRGDRGAIEHRLQQATGDRIRALERAIEHEWNAFGEATDDPARQLTEQAASLAESCVTAANLALRGFSNAEARLAALERDIQAGMSQLTRELQAVIFELRSSRPPGAGGATFPLESVMRIHQEMRESSDAAAPEALKDETARTLPPPAESAAALNARVESLEKAVERAAESAAADGVPPRATWRPLYAAIALVVMLAGLALFGLWMQRRLDARLDAAARQVTAAERDRDAAIASARDEAARQIADARQSAAHAQVVGNVLAAPDLVRYWLTSAGPDSRAYAQVLYSRSRGMVFSASRLEPPGAGRNYQLWMLTSTGPVSAGVVSPDSAGRVTFVTDAPPTVPGRLTGALVTVEPQGNAKAPRGSRVLVRVDTAGTSLP